MTTPASPYGPPPRLPYRRPAPSVVAALGIVVTYFVLAFLQVAVAGLYNWGSSRFQDNFLLIGPNAVFAMQQEIPVLIVVAVVSFLFFWGIAPIHESLRLGQVLGRAVCAALAAGLLSGVALIVVYLGTISNLAAQSSGLLGANDILRSSAEAVVQGASYFVQTSPLVVLGAVILWNWTRTHPLRTAAAPEAADAPTLV
jgi:hypothetical protein